MLNLLCICTAGVDWVNGYDKPLEFECPSGYSITRYISQHSNSYEDRQWAFECGRVTPTAQSSICDWYDNMNDFDKVLDFQCPTNYFLNGLSSYHDNSYEDRRWSLLCCTDTNLISGQPILTEYINDYDEIMDYPLYYPDDDGYYSKGLYSQHNNDRE